MGNNFEIWWKFLGWHCLSFGLHVDLTAPHIEIHVPFGFARVGWDTRIKTPKGYTWKTGLYTLYPFSTPDTKE